MPRKTKHQDKVLKSILRQILILRDGEFCLKCGKTERLSASHIYPKGRYRSMEYEPDNLKLLCYYCHIHWWHKNPIEAKEWLANTISKKRLKRLHTMSLTQGWKFDYNLQKIFLESELKKLEKESENGFTE